MRFPLAALIVMVAAPSLAAAQGISSNPTGTIPPLRGPLPTGTIPSVPLPQIGLPMPQIGLPHPTVGVVRTGPGRVGPGRAGPNDITSRRAFQNPGVRGRGFNRNGFNPYGFNQGYAVPFPFFVYPETVYMVADPGLVAPAPVVQPKIEHAPTGSLDLQVQPQGAQVFIDGYYMGRPMDFLGDFALEAGAHTLKIEAPGYEALNLDFKITVDQTITYEADLKPTAAARPAAPPAAPAQPKTFYMIPGCYLGDVPPKDAGLPATCDQSRAVTFQR